MANDNFIKTRWGKAICIGLVAAVIITTAILLIRRCAINNTIPAPYELSESEKFLIGTWEIYDVGFADSVPESGSKAYTTDPKLTELWERAQLLGFIFDGTVIDSAGSTPTKGSNDAYLQASGNTNRNWALPTAPADTPTDYSCYNVFAKCKNNDGLLYFYFTHDPSDTNAYDNLMNNQSILHFANYYAYQDEWGSYHELAPINSTVVGRRAQAVTERDTIRLTLIPYNSADRIVWYEFARI